MNLTTNPVQEEDTVHEDITIEAVLQLVLAEEEVMEGPVNTKGHTAAGGLRKRRRTQIMKLNKPGVRQ